MKVKIIETFLFASLQTLTNRNIVTEAASAVLSSFSSLPLVDVSSLLLCSWLIFSGVVSQRLPEQFSGPQAAFCMHSKGQLGAAGTLKWVTELIF